ncbi:beta-1,3-galactosyltransferase 1-like isoform 2-T2 [Odontesthes bonariensis]|uniref:beta-1,3-galactosyltransferase 1-like isoform X2 n=1 Tax=Odontesthes bonariensis TaxID=219752 RepID=UPI003F5856E0
MLESSVSKCEKTRWTKARRCLYLSMLLLMMGTLVSLRSLASWPLHFWVKSSLFSRLYNNKTTQVKSLQTSSTFEYFVEYPHKYDFILDEPSRCGQERPFLVLMVPVTPHNRDARDIIRRTWGSQTTVLGQTVSHFFLLGLSNEGDGTEHPEPKVLQESQRHHDILQSNFVDSYKNLTIKTMVMFEWLSGHCPIASYAMKVDSDIFLNVHNLVDMLLNAPRHLYMTGLVARDAEVLRDHNSKWFMPVTVFPESIYPPYALGLGYVFSLDLTKRILEASTQVKAVYIEDVYVGLCLRHLGIALTDPPHDGLFKTGVPLIINNCYWTSVITTILENSEQLLKVWGTYQTRAQHEC